MVPESDEELLAECAVETYKSSGKGGQHVNTTESAVRLRHLPTGITATSQAERSQHRNKRAALKTLRRLPPSRTRAKQLAAAKSKNEAATPAQLLAAM